MRADEMPMTGGRRIPETEVSAVADDLYAAALGDASWESALDRICALMSASMGAITVFDTVSGKPRQSMLHRVDAGAPGGDLDDLRPTEPKGQFLAGPGSGVPIYDYLYTPEGEIDRDPYYAWHTRAAKTRYYIGGSVTLGDGLSAALSLHRSREQGHVQPRDVNVYRALFRHFERAMRIATHVARGAGAHEGWDALLEHSPLGIVSLDGSGRVLRANATARRLAALADGFAIGEEGMSALRRGDDAQLQRLIGLALAPPSTEIEAGMAVRLGRRTGDPDYLVVASRVPGSDRLFSILSPRAVVLIADPAARSGPGDERLRRLFGLTPAELRLAGHLMSGASLEEAAKLSNVGMPTLRTQLASMFRKTGTDRQGELLRRLLSVPWQIDAG